MREQRNAYRGYPPRPWLNIVFLAPDGTKVAVDLLADTGCPYDAILAPEIFDRLYFSDLFRVDSNFGPMIGGWVRLYMPELDLVEFAMVFGSADVAASARADHPDFVGFVGLPILRLAEYGGNSEEFWIRTPS